MTATAASAQIALAALPGQIADTGSARPMLQAAVYLSTADAAQADPAPVAPTPTPIPAVVATADPAPDARQVECMAKVIVHEAGNQPYRGQVAVAQVIRARMKDGRFGSDACSVVGQRGQFFDVDAYQPARTDARWTNAVAIAADTLNGTGEDVVPGALFFRSGNAAMRGRVRLAQVADHIFYR